MKEKLNIKNILYFGGSSAIIGAILMALIFFYHFLTLPKIESLDDYRPSLPTKILSKDGQVLLQIGSEIRELAEIEEIPQLIINSFLAAEDDNFYDHQGIDYFGLIRAMLKNIKAGRVVQGGSTITQQVAKSLLLTRERSISRKIKDFLLAQQIEKKLTKDEILYLYLNQVYLGGGYYGVKAAFKGYYGKELSEVNAAEAALVAGLLVAPGRYSPYLNPEYAKQRQEYVLGRMRDTEKISEEEYQEAIDLKLKFYNRRLPKMKGGHFTDWIRQTLNEKMGEDFSTGGYQVVSTLDWDMQKVAEEAVYNGLKEIDKRQGYAGPLKNTKKPDEIKKYELKFREDIFDEKSNFFHLLPDGTKEHEVSFDKEKYFEMKEKYFEKNKSIPSKRFLLGNSEEDNMPEILNIEDEYKAIVLKISRIDRLAYVNIGGSLGVIPYEHYRWAYERQISEDRLYKSYITYPDEALKVGDVVYVKVIKKSDRLWNNIYSKIRSQIKGSAIIEFLKNQKVIVCALDQKPEVEGALIALNPDNGEIISMVGGSDFNKSQFNRAIQSFRQPGSSFKPLLYAAALEEGYTPATIILDSPEALGGVDESLNWKPRNYDGKFLGPITFRTSLEKSRNVTTIKMASDIGVDKIFTFLDRIGFKAKMDRDLSIALGSFGVTLLDMVRAYSLFVNGGMMLQPQAILKVVDRNGEEVDWSKPNEEEVAEELKEEEIENPAVEESPEEIASEEKEEFINPFHKDLNDNYVYDNRLAYIMTNLLRGVIRNGTGRAARGVSNFIGGKTGTTNNYVDAWFLGFSSNVVTGVWTGFDDNKSMGWPETGSKSALPIWAAYMSESVRKYGEADFRAPPGIINVMTDAKTGQIAQPYQKETLMEAFVKGTEPGSEDPIFKQEEEIQDSSQIFEDDDYYNN